MIAVIHLIAVVHRAALCAMSFGAMLILFASVIGLVVLLSTIVWRGLILVTKAESAEGPQTMAKLTTDPARAQPAGVVGRR
jgi:hypothetical protein